MKQWSLRILFNFHVSVPFQRLCLSITSFKSYRELLKIVIGIYTESLVAISPI